MASQGSQVTDSKAESKSKYFMESEEEINRLSNQHLVIKDAMGGQLVYAPLNYVANSLKILDSGAADGTWVVDFNRSTGGQHQIVGTDIQEKDLPKTGMPSNIVYRVQDINNAWPSEYKNSFDLVHQRLTMVGAGPNWQGALEGLAGMVKPGGWIQLMESENTFPSQTENPAMYDFFTLMTGIFKVMGAPLTLADDMPSWLARNGFESIQQKQILQLQGHANPNSELAKRGLYSNIVAAKGLVTFASSLPDPPVPKQRLETLVEDLQTELANKGAAFPHRLMWAQKKDHKSSQG